MSACRLRPAQMLRWMDSCTARLLLRIGERHERRGEAIRAIFAYRAAVLEGDSAVIDEARRRLQVIASQARAQLSG